MALRSVGATIVALVVWLISVTATLAQGPPQYELMWIGDGRPRDINEAGLVAVGYADYLYDHATGQKIFLNQPSFNATWIDQEGLGGNWTVHHCNGINEFNQVVGNAFNVIAQEERNFILDDPLGPAPVFTLIPSSSLSAANGNVCINDLSEVKEGREVNNSGVVVGSGWIQFPDENVETFEGHFFTGINDAGMVTGYREGIYTGPPSKRRDGGTLLFHYQDPPQLLESGTETNYHGDINNFGDVAFSESGRGFIYVAGSAGPVNLDARIVAQSQQDYDDWINTPIFPTGINDAGQIIGQANVNGWQGFILTPVAEGPGISISPTSGLVTDEAGGQDSFDVVLDTEPSANVTIGISSSDTSEGTVDVSSLTFTPVNWDIPQTVTVTGVDDPDLDGDQPYTVITAAATSADPDYNGLDAEDVSVTNQDDEQAPSTTYNSTDTPLDIPDNDSSGVSSNIFITDEFQIADLNVTLDIDHQRSGDLEVYLIGPDNSQVELFNFSGNNDVTAFNGSSTQGLWTLQVIDTRNKKTGTLNSWSMTAEH